MWGHSLHNQSRRWRCNGGQQWFVEWHRRKRRVERCRSERNRRQRHSDERYWNIRLEQHRRRQRQRSGFRELERYGSERRSERLVERRIRRVVEWLVEWRAVWIVEWWLGRKLRQRLGAARPLSDG
jgi:hypothetical protein